MTQGLPARPARNVQRAWARCCPQRHRAAAPPRPPGHAFPVRAPWAGPGAPLGPGRRAGARRCVALRCAARACAPRGEQGLQRAPPRWAQAQAAVAPATPAPPGRAPQERPLPEPSQLQVQVQVQVQLALQEPPPAAPRPQAPGRKPPRRGRQAAASAMPTRCRRPPQPPRPPHRRPRAKGGPVRRARATVARHWPGTPACAGPVRRPGHARRRRAAAHQGCMTW